MDDSKMQREQRLAAALRANLHRRKQQARERDRSESDEPEDPNNPTSQPSGPASSGGKS